jgi:hypothetical protein
MNKRQIIKSLCVTKIWLLDVTFMNVGYSHDWVNNAQFIGQGWINYDDLTDKMIFIYGSFSLIIIKSNHASVSRLLKNIDYSVFS